MNRHPKVPFRTLFVGLPVCFICILAPAAGRLAADTLAFLPGDAEAAEVTFRLVSRAQSRLDMSYFAIHDDTFSGSFLNLLLNAAHRGVRVRIVVDGVFSKISPEMQVVLLSSGVQIREYHPPRVSFLRSITRRLHDKCLLRDGAEMITGSRNIGDTHFGLAQPEHENYLNLDVHLTGRVVARACRYFDDLWESDELKEVDLELARRRARRQRPGESKKNAPGQPVSNGCSAGREICGPICQHSVAVDQPAPLPECRRCPPVGHVALHVDHKNLWFLYDPSGRKNNCCDTRENLYRILRSARHSIILESPYFVPSGELGRILRDALARDVRVLILTNSLLTTDLPLVYSGYRNVIGRYQKLGADVWEYTGPRIFHAKALVVDGRVACVTSFNFDPRSAHLDTQLGVVACDPRAAAVLLGILESHFAQAMPIEQLHTPFSPGRPFPATRAAEPCRYAPGETIHGWPDPDGRETIGPARFYLMRVFAPVVWGQL